jgi:hypothetical protein
LARATFCYVLTKEEGVTTELHSRIVAARVSGSSLNALRRELVINRYQRMHETIAAYYEHCHSYSNQHRQFLRLGFFAQLYQGEGARHRFPDMPPLLSNPDAYFDHEPPSVQFMSELCQRWAERNAELSIRYAQQQVADLVCIDATFKVAKRIRASPSRMLWSMMDISTGCILNQQMLTHERHEDVLPMFRSYAARCRELGKPLPTRVCSDRGLMDANVINHDLAFPDAHINVDPWHFHQLFNKTLNKTTEVWKDVSKQFADAMYVTVKDSKGTEFGTHAEPGRIIAIVDALITHYSNCGSRATPCITQATKKWWAVQREAIVSRRICSHPAADSGSTVRMSSSALENYHKQLNKLLRIARCSEESMHGFLLQFMLRWNIDRRRAAELEFDWRIHDLQLLHRSFQACVRVISKPDAVALWHGHGFELPPQQMASSLGSAESPLPSSPVPTTAPVPSLSAASSSASSQTTSIISSFFNIFSSSSSSSSPLAAAVHSSAIASSLPEADDEHDGSASGKGHWASEATAHFLQLWAQHGYDWSYESFVTEWPAEEYGDVDKRRFQNKCSIEKRKKERLSEDGKGGAGKRQKVMRKR